VVSHSILFLGQNCGWSKRWKPAKKHPSMKSETEPEHKVKDYFYWSKQRETLRGRFTMGTIIKMNREQLEHDLLVLANTQHCDALPGQYYEQKSQEHQRETDAFTFAIKHLLDYRINETRHKWTIWLSVIAIIVSVIAVIISIFKN
jgi:hypothetical protein